MRTLFAGERLGIEPPRAAPPRRTGFLRLLLAREPLAFDAESPPRPRRGWLRLMFAVEPLDAAPEPAPGPRRRRWLRSLFELERIEPP